MKNNLNKEELLLREKLNEASFEFKEADWIAIEDRLPKKSFWSKFGTSFKAAAALITIASVVYFLSDQPTIAEKNKTHSKDFIQYQSNQIKNTSRDTEIKSDKITAVDPHKNQENNAQKELDQEVNQNQKETTKIAANSTPKTNKKHPEASQEIEKSNTQLTKDNPSILTSREQPNAEAEETQENELSFVGIHISKNRCIGNTINIEAKIEGKPINNVEIKVDHVERGNEKSSWSSNSLNLSFSPDFSGNYKVRVVENLQGDQIIHHKEIIYIDEVDQTNFTYKDFTSPFEDYTVEFEANHAIGEKFDWIIEDTEHSSQSSKFSHTFNNSGVFDVTLIETFHNGCTSKVSKPVAVIRDFDPTVEKDFTPNGDGLNDDFMPEAFLLRDEAFSMVIYSGTGNVLFQTNSVHKPWNGRINNTGELQNPGLYIWKATLTSEEGREIPYTGWIRIKDL